MSISELTGKIFTNMGKRVIIFSLLVGNEGGGREGGLLDMLVFRPPPDGTTVAEELVILTICHLENSNDCGNPSFIWVRWLVGFRVLLHGFP